MKRHFIAISLALLVIGGGASAKPTGGMLLAPGELGPGIGFAYTVELKASEPTKIDVLAKKGDVDCFLLKQDGNLVQRVTDGPGCKLTVTPKEKTTYVFLVHNASTTERAEYTTFMQ